MRSVADEQEPARRGSQDFGRGRIQVVGRIADLDDQALQVLAPLLLIAHQDLQLDVLFLLDSNLLLQQRLGRLQLTGVVGGALQPFGNGAHSKVNLQCHHENKTHLCDQVNQSRFGLKLRNDEHALALGPERQRHTQNAEHAHDDCAPSTQ